MNPTCAACMRPIVKGRNGKVTIVGTEAFHQACVLAGGVERSALHKAEAKYQALRRVNAELDNAIQMFRSEMDAKMAHLDKRASDLERFHRNELGDLKARHERRLVEAGDEQIRLQRRIADLEAELRATKNELALEKALPKAPIQMDPEKTSSDEDGTAIRFGLIELS